MTGASCERKTVHEVDLQQDQTMTATLSPKVTYGMLPLLSSLPPSQGIWFFIKHKTGTRARGGCQVGVAEPPAFERPVSPAPSKVCLLTHLARSLTCALLVTGSSTH